jgi:branched-subunit amino acid ABC-type transport system permease component
MMMGTSASALAVAVAAFFAWTNKNPSTVLWIYGVVAVLVCVALVMERVTQRVQYAPEVAPMVVTMEKDT